VAIGGKVAEDRNKSSSRRRGRAGIRQLDWVRNEIARVRGQIRAQEREIRPQRAGVSTASATAAATHAREGRRSLPPARNLSGSGPRGIEIGLKADFCPMFYDWFGGFSGLSIHLRAAGSCNGSSSQHGQT
jgi:hypothetical protein